MLILLPPSETKATAESGPTLNLDTLSFPSLSPVRRQLIERLETLCSEDPDQAHELLKLSDRQRDELDHNAQLTTAPCMPAIRMYTGVAYDALAVDGFDPKAKVAAALASARSDKDTGAALTDDQLSPIAIGSALFGISRAQDLLPHYRLSATHKPLGEPLKKTWGSAVKGALTQWYDNAPSDANALYDFRSGGYAALGGPKDAITLRVEKEKDDGSRSVVNHFNKLYKGVVVRAMVQTATSVADTDAIDFLQSVISDLGARSEVNGNEVTLIVADS